MLPARKCIARHPCPCTCLAWPAWKYTRNSSGTRSKARHWCSGVRASSKRLMCPRDRCWTQAVARRCGSHKTSGGRTQNTDRAWTQCRLPLRLPPHTRAWKVAHAIDLLARGTGWKLGSLGCAAGVLRQKETSRACCARTHGRHRPDQEACEIAANTPANTTARARAEHVRSVPLNSQQCSTRRDMRKGHAVAQHARF